MEAKMTDQPRLSITGENGLNAKQWQAGCRWAEAGALVGVVWQFKGSVAWIPWRTVHAAVMDGRRSIRLEQSILIPSGMGFILYDWIKVAIESENQFA